ncbi:Uncharacterised protein [Bordetella pertussis]|nr:Uncharacterised protein [Bordetella pertussis]
MATVPPRPSATPTGTPISIRVMNTANSSAAIMSRPCAGRSAGARRRPRAA